jgi:dissimilatory sulfite reductase related protein
LLTTFYQPPDAVLNPETLLDQDGYVIDALLWNRQLARRIAAGIGIARLEDEHWRVLLHVREKFLHFGVPPLMRNVCHRLGLDPVHARRLFGGCQQVWRIAGLPNPGEEARAHVN